MAYYSDPNNLFPGYTTNEDASAVFPAVQLPTCSGVAASANLQDIKEILYSMLTVIADDYASLPAYASGVDVQTQAKNFSITSGLAAGSNATTIKNFVVSFTVNSPLTDVTDENEYNPD
jgi:hypothetical protein